MTPARRADPDRAMTVASEVEVGRPVLLTTAVEVEAAPTPEPPVELPEAEAEAAATVPFEAAACRLALAM